VPASHADGLTLAAALITAAVMGLLAFGPPSVLALPLLLGTAWIFALTALTALNGTAQAILPNRVRGRVLAVYLTMFNGAMAAGSLGSGAVAEASAIPGALLIAAALAVVALVLHG
jgi:predicted MFS family arabinose efflux permease